MNRQDEARVRLLEIKIKALENKIILLSEKQSEYTNGNTLWAWDDKGDRYMQISLANAIKMLMQYLKIELSFGGVVIRSIKTSNGEGVEQDE